jgi:hypothetical protein
MIFTTIYKLLACHMLGDYVIQTDFLARTKGESWWHLLAHCVTYTVPFAVVFGVDWRVALLLTTHIVIDALKARWKVIDYLMDQSLHLLVIGIYLF